MSINGVDDARQTLADLEGKLAAAAAREIELATEGRRLHSMRRPAMPPRRRRSRSSTRRPLFSTGTARTLHMQSKRPKGALARPSAPPRWLCLPETPRLRLLLQRECQSAVRRLTRPSRSSRRNSKALADDITKLNQLGCGFPRAEQLGVLGQLATNSALMFTPIRLRHLAPNERRDFVGFLTQWRDGVKRWASAYLEQDAA